MKKYIIMPILFGVLLSSCDFTHTIRLGKTNYYILDEIPSVGLYYEYPDMEDMLVGVVGGRIKNAYWNDQYILGTQHAVRSDSIIGYFIVKMLPPVKKGVPWEKIELSTKEEYEQKKRELSLNEKEMKHITLK
jgi:hypothetical protein